MRGGDGNNREGRGWEKEGGRGGERARRKRQERRAKATSGEREAFIRYNSQELIS